MKEATGVKWFKLAVGETANITILNGRELFGQGFSHRKTPKPMGQNSIQCNRTGYCPICDLIYGSYFENGGGI